MALLASALLTIVMANPYPGPWVPWSSIHRMGGTVSPATHSVVEDALFSRTITATDTDEWRRQTGAETYETRILASDAHRAVIVAINSASWAGPLALTGYDGLTGTYTYHHTLRARIIAPKTQETFFDYYEVRDSAASPHRDAALPLMATVIITARKTPAPPGGTPPPGPGGRPASGGS
jgi:hypothetical protein